MYTSTSLLFRHRSILSLTLNFKLRYSFKEPVTSPYGAPVVHAQTLTRRGSAKTHQMGTHGNTINPKAVGLKVGGEYAAASSVAGSEFQSEFRFLTHFEGFILFSQVIYAWM